MSLYCTSLRGAHPPSRVELLRRGTRLPGGGSNVTFMVCFGFVFPVFLPPVSVPHLFPWILINYSSPVPVLPVCVPCYLNPVFPVSCVRRYMSFLCSMVIFHVDGFIKRLLFIEDYSRVPSSPHSLFPVMRDSSCLSFMLLNF